MPGILETLIREAAGQQHQIVIDDTAARSLELTEAAAKEFNHAYMGTGHLLIGLMREGSLAPVFELACLDPDQIASQLRENEYPRAVSGSGPFFVSQVLNTSLAWLVRRNEKADSSLTNTGLLEATIYVNDSRARSLMELSLPDHNDILRISNVVNSPVGGQALEAFRTLRQALANPEASKFQRAQLIQMLQLEANRSSVAFDTRPR